MPTYVPPTSTYSMPTYVPPTSTYSMPTYVPLTTTSSMPDSTYSMPNSSDSMSQPAYSLQPPNLYKKLIDIELLQSFLEAGSAYNICNDIVFAVRTKMMKADTIINEGQELLFDEHNDVNYKLSRDMSMIKKKNSILSVYNGILSVSIPDDPFNIKNQNEFKKAIINDNKISFKNIRLTQIGLTQIEDSPIYLINLTDKDYNIKIREE